MLLYSEKDIYKESKMGQGKGGLKRKMLGIWYDKNGNIKRIDAQGMSPDEVTAALKKKKEAK